MDGAGREVMFGMKLLHRTYVHRAVPIMANGGVRGLHGGGPFHVLTTYSTTREHCPFSGGLSVDSQIIGYLSPHTRNAKIRAD